jgi:ADP-ribosyl-[dinitrogen reductase] hydrolase
MNMIDRARGALVGLAVGDAMGAPVEFRAMGSFAPVTTYRSGGAHGLNAGEWTDDTSMALALADSLRKKGWDLNDQVERYIAWWQEGQYSVNGRCFDIGSTCSTALGNYIEQGKINAPSWEGDSGNGCIMRIAPVAIRYAHLYPVDCKKLAQLGEESSSTTHGSDMCRSASSYMTVLLAALINGATKEQVLDPDWYKLPLHPSVDQVVRGSYKLKSENTVVGSGFVVHSLEAALWAFHKADSFSQAVLYAVNLGNDADTTGAVAGQLAGAHWGEQAIPVQWRNGLARYDMINEQLDGLMLFN